MEKLAVVALGGNALLRGNQLGTIDEQEDNTRETIESLIFLIKAGYNLVITHGNGPQVGNILMRNEAGSQVYGIAQMPLDVCVADSQGGIGYMIERILKNALKDHHIQKEVVTLVTQVIVNKDDPAFQNPTKRVGKIYDKEQADQLAAEKGWIFKEESKTKGGWRRVVASPVPVGVMNEKVIKTMAKHGTIVIAVGGGGIPVYIDENQNIRPSEAVIDKDLASALLGVHIKADEFYILTDVSFIYKNFNTESQEKLEFLDYADASKYLQEGVFGEGSMAPKVRAALKFIEGGGKMSIITDAKLLEDTRYGSKITMKYDNNLNEYKAKKTSK